MTDAAFRDSHQTPVTTGNIEFGLGDTGCTLAIIATTFSPRDRIRVVAANVPRGGDVTIRLMQYGKVLDGYPVTRSPDQASDCASDDLPPLPVGHYEVRISMASGPLDPAPYIGEFDVTP